MKKNVISIVALLVIVMLGGVFTIREMVFPIKYKDEIKKYSKEYSLDLYEVAAFINFETKFQNKKYEENNTNGLMNFRDKKAIEVAKKMELKDFKPKDLEIPEVAINLGSYYLSKLKEEHLSLSKVASEWAMRNNPEDEVIREYSKKYYLPKIERRIKIYKILYPGLKL
ncbi:transglycosylase SLT domain-containing protein [Clostridium amazonitimonense]|uniref:transglycosylase SLT domain-containing protein n=1 Tax=Clostridium amazonitimonense TaxID=1499689 RepID=UPI00050953CE|nr:transglycosylase SLT domain-containing protein [Clostridium amazonitimonense]